MVKNGFGRYTTFSYFREGVTTHSTIDKMDDDDGRQETLTSSDTTHNTNKTIFCLQKKSTIYQWLDNKKDYSF